MSQPNGPTSGSAAAFADLKQEFSHLFVRDLARAYGGVKAVDGVSFTVQRNEIVGLIGPNGAGKTTVFNLITGIDQPQSGEVYFDRRFITGMPAHRIVRLGLARTFQNIRLLGHLSVLDNVKIAYHYHCRYHLLDAMVRSRRYYREERALTTKAMAFLRLVGLDHLAQEEASSLAYGLRRKLELARALATEGNLLLLDEPAAGMNPRETAELIALMARINREFGVTILLIEHDMRVVMNLCQRLLVMDHGKLIAAGPVDQVRQDPRVIAAYLGVKRGAQVTPPEPVIPAVESERQAD